MPDISSMALLFAMAGVPEVGDPPSGAPSNMSVSTYGANYWRVNWDNGDVEAYTRVYQGAIGSVWADSTFLSAELPGVTFANTGLSAGTAPEEELETDDDYRFFLRHFRNGELSAIVFLDTTEA